MEFQRPVFMCFLDLEKTVDWVQHDKLFEMQEHRQKNNEKFISMTNCIYVIRKLITTLIHIKCNVQMKFPSFIDFIYYLCR